MVVGRWNFQNDILEICFSALNQFILNYSSIVRVDGDGWKPLILKHDSAFPVLNNFQEVIGEKVAFFLSLQTYKDELHFFN